MSRCWAYNSENIRCVLDAGHEEPHTMYITWMDDECWTPDLPNVAKTNIPTAAPTFVPTVNEVTKCVACGHQHKAGTCKCGCHEQIG